MSRRPSVRTLVTDPEVAARVARLLGVSEPPPTSVTSPEDVVSLVRPYLAGRETEALICVAVDRRNRPIDVAVLTTGSSGFTIVDPSQILRWVLTRTRPANAFILAHNHPSGDPTPSAQDHEVTTRVNAAARAVGLRLLDHVIVTDDPGAWTSLASTGALVSGYPSAPGVTG